LPENWQRAGFGLYIHWPFCAAKCPYCDFNSHVSDTIDQDHWERAYRQEILRIGHATAGRVLSSIYFGGGTPSLMSAGLVAAVLDQIRTTWTLANAVEITLEANPTSVEADRFSGYAEAGVNRLSLGVQALNDVDLKRLGRLHSVSDAISALDLARSIFENVSFDLIYGRQDQSLGDWEAELANALSFGPDHLSLYQLTIESNTAFGDRYRRGGLPGLPDEDLSADLFELTNAMCGEVGLDAYEVSNYANNGAEGRHNLIYWRSGDYAGIGPGAHGRLCLGGNRIASETHLSPSTWLQSVERAGSGESARQILSAEEIFSETLMMGLRLAEGVDLSCLNPREGFESRVRKLEGLGLLEARSGNLRATPTGRAVLNSVLKELL